MIEPGGVVGILNSMKEKQMEVKIEDRIKAAIDKIRPQLQADGGDIEFVTYEAGKVNVRLKGACSGCPAAQMTLKMGVERLLKKEVPEVISVSSV